MGLFDEVKQNVTVRQAAEMYGLKPNRSGLIRCIFHNDKSPSMKVDRRYYCFGCGCTGDAIDFTAQLFGLGLRDAAMKLEMILELTTLPEEEIPCQAEETFW